MSKSNANEANASGTTGKDSVTAAAREEAVSLKETATRRIKSETEKRKHEVAEELRGVSATLKGKKTPDGEAAGLSRDLLDHTARLVDDAASTIDELDPRDAIRSARGFARENPLMFIAGCALAGFAAARLMRADAA